MPGPPTGSARSIPEDAGARFAVPVALADPGGAKEPEADPVTLILGRLGIWAVAAGAETEAPEPEVAEAVPVMVGREGGEESEDGAMPPARDVEPAPPEMVAAAFSAAAILSRAALSAAALSAAALSAAAFAAAAACAAAEPPLLPPAEGDGLFAAGEGLFAEGDGLFAAEPPLLPPAEGDGLFAAAPPPPTFPGPPVPPPPPGVPEPLPGPLPAELPVCPPLVPPPPAPAGGNARMPAGPGISAPPRDFSSRRSSLLIYASI